MNDESVSIKYHFVELRRRLTLSVIPIVVCTGLAFVFHEQILTLLMAPAQGFAETTNQKPVYTELTEFIGVAMKVSLLVGLSAAMPFVLYQAVMFVSPGLKPTEKRYLYTLMPFSMLVFLAGAIFGYKILFPPAVSFLLSFGSDVATPYIRIGNYVNLMISLLFWMGIVFETPVVMFFLAKIGVVKPRFFAKQRRYAVVVAFILGAIITPTFDPVNQSLVAAPIIILYELGIWLAKWASRGHREPAFQPETDDNNTTSHH